MQTYVCQQLALSASLPFHGKDTEEPPEVEYLLTQSRTGVKGTNSGWSKYGVSEAVI